MRSPLPSHYRGWTISRNASAPVYARWHGRRHGVNVSAPTKDGVKAMIDTKVETAKRGFSDGT